MICPVRTGSEKAATRILAVSEDYLRGIESSRPAISALGRPIRRRAPVVAPELMETNLSKIFALISIAFGGLAGADYVSVASTVSTNSYEYCLQDYSSGIRKCSFD